MKNNIIWCCLLLSSFQSFSQNSETIKDSLDNTKEKYFSFSFENDVNFLMIPKKRNAQDFDRNYTMGLGFYWSNPNSYVANIRRWLSKPFKTVDFRSWHEDYQENDYNTLGNISYIAGAAFTPDSLLSKTPILNDRPYAFILQTGATESYLSNNFDKLITYGFSIGIYGSPIGKWIQSGIHKYLYKGDNFAGGKQPYIPQGWNNQISDNKFMPTFLYTYKIDHLINNKSIDPFRKPIVSIAYSYEFLLGQQTGGSLEIYGKIGKIDSRNWYRKLNNLTNVNKNNVNKTSDYFFCKSRKWEFFLAFSIKQNLILYNQSLSGGDIFGTEFNLAPLKETRFAITEGLLGLGVTIPTNRQKHKYLEISYAPFQFRTSEMKKPFIQRTHYWGGINFKWINR
jgi:hypothetical protein